MYSSTFGWKIKERTTPHGPHHSHAHESNRSKTDSCSHPSQLRALGSYRTTTGGGPRAHLLKNRTSTDINRLVLLQLDMQKAPLMITPSRVEGEGKGQALGIGEGMLWMETVWESLLTSSLRAHGRWPPLTQDEVQRSSSVGIG